MVANKEVKSINAAQFDNEQARYFENRQEQDRRSEPSDGFAYISIVGWIDRRERRRRNDDTYTY
jgi:hypothetical protein